MWHKNDNTIFTEIEYTWSDIVITSTPWIDSHLSQNIIYFNYLLKLFLMDTTNVVLVYNPRKPLVNDILSKFFLLHGCYGILF